MSEPSLQDDVLQELGDDKVQEIAQLLGTDADGAQAAVGTTVDAVAGELRERADGEDAGEVREALAGLAEPGQEPLRGVAALGGLGGLLGGGMMAGVLSKLSRPIATSVAKKTGIPVATVTRALEVMIPALLTVLAKRASAKRAGAGSPVSGAQPAGGDLGDLLGSILGGGKKQQ
ncbi:DUF937 domain-containing protein [Streptomyces sp. NPDC005813]|uniref:DUF937 domain-containing protein n=1 Tax=Streptomyces sp. NPDC005813 TaxID=3155592 RepID=UPI0033D8CAE9